MTKLGKVRSVLCP